MFAGNKSLGVLAILEHMGNVLISVCWFSVGYSDLFSIVRPHRSILTFIELAF